MTVKRTTTRRIGERMTNAETAEAKIAFLEEMAKSGLISRGLRKANISRGTYRNWRKDDPEFEAQFQDALEEANDVIRGAIYERGVEGWLEPVYQRGEKVGSVRRFSDSMLKLLAQSRMRAEFADRSDITTNGQALASGEAIATAMSDPETAAMADELLQRIAGNQEQ